MAVAEKKRNPKMVLTPQERQERQRERERLLSQLVYEMVDGKPVYYAGYQDVLNGLKQPEEIMRSSYLQGSLIDLLLEFLYAHPMRKQFKYLTNEIGVQIKKKTWRSCDIAIYEKERLKGVPITDSYMALPPDYVIEVDTKADLSKYQYQHDYFVGKTKQLHEFGVKKVVWIFTKNLPVIWESDSADTIIIRQGWDHDVTITEGLTFNLAQLVAQAEE